MYVIYSMCVLLGIDGIHGIVLYYDLCPMASALVTYDLCRFASSSGSLI